MVSYKALNTTKKWISFYICYGFGDGDGLQGWATIKRTVANARHGVWDCDRLQGRATIKRTAANARHGLGYGDGQQGAATIVFANRFISEIYFLNGRKVVTLILQKTKNGKI